MRVTSRFRLEHPFSLTHETLITDAAWQTIRRLLFSTGTLNLPFLVEFFKIYLTDSDLPKFHPGKTPVS
jgi:hypothetical protein